MAILKQDTNSIQVQPDWKRGSLGGREKVFAIYKEVPLKKKKKLFQE